MKFSLANEFTLELFVAVQETRTTTKSLCKSSRQTVSEYLVEGIDLKEEIQKFNENFLIIFTK